MKPRGLTWPRKVGRHRVDGAQRSEARACFTGRGTACGLEVTSWRELRDVLPEVSELRDRAKRVCEETETLLKDRRLILAITRVGLRTRSQAQRSSSQRLRIRARAVLRSIEPAQ